MVSLLFIDEIVFRCQKVHFTYPFIRWRTFRLCFLAIVNRGAMSMPEQVSVEHDVKPFGQMPSCGITGSVVDLFSTIWEFFPLVSRVAAPVCNLTNGEWMFPLPHIHSIICCWSFVDLMHCHSCEKKPQGVLICISPTCKNYEHFLKYFLDFQIFFCW